MTKKQETQYYNEHRLIACERLEITVNQYNYLRRISNDLNQIDCDNCNGDLTESEYEDKEQDLLNQLGEYLTKIKRPFSLFEYHQTDPRGASLYMDTKEISRDRYTDAVCIY